MHASTWLGALALLYTGATTVHFIHNAELLSEYPNLPASLTRLGVYYAFMGVLAVGAAGLTMYRFGWQRAGLLVIGVYAALGFDGLLHYTRAPFTDHSVGMNSTILFEVAAAAALLSAVVVTMAKRLRALAR